MRLTYPFLKFPTGSECKKILSLPTVDEHEVCIDCDHIVETTSKDLAVALRDDGAGSQPVVLAVIAFKKRFSSRFADAAVEFRARAKETEEATTRTSDEKKKHRLEREAVCFRCAAEYLDNWRQI